MSSRHPTEAAREAGGEMDEALVERVGAEASGRSMRRHALGRRHAADDEHADDEAVDGDDAGHDDGTERLHHQIGAAASARSQSSRRWIAMAASSTARERSATIDALHRAHAGNADSRFARSVGRADR